MREQLEQKSGVIGVESTEDTLPMPTPFLSSAYEIQPRHRPATKYLGGHDDVSADVLAGPTALLEDAWRLSIVLGAVNSPFDSWLLLRGLRTLALRVARQNENGLRLASFLAAHPAIEVVHYPGLPSHPQHGLASQQMRGFGGVMSVVVKGGYAAAERLVDAFRVRVWRLSQKLHRADAGRRCLLVLGPV